FTVGFLTGFHCIGMCGGFVMNYTQGVQGRRAVFFAHLSYALGKNISYALLGAVFGALGAVLTITPHMRGIAALVAGIFLVLFGNNAAAWKEGHPRNDVLAQIQEKGLATWKKESGYHHRSLAENAMYRLKQLFGDHLASRLFESQVVEVHARIAAMNVMTYLGMPVSVRVGATIA
ncbi:MAG: urease accessory protein UreH domain-containing protein, partial [Sulfuricurvum sp.]